MNCDRVPHVPRYTGLAAVGVALRRTPEGFVVGTKLRTVTHAWSRPVPKASGAKLLLLQRQRSKRSWKRIRERRKAELLKRKVSPGSYERKRQKAG